MTDPNRVTRLDSRDPSPYHQRDPMFLPHLKPGSDFQTVLSNALALFKKGFPKAQALSVALEIAGYRPPDQPAHP